MVSWLVWLVWLTTLTWISVQGTERRVCYYTNWSQYRPSSGRFLPENINATLCTHIAIAFAKMTDRLGAYEWNDESTPYRKGMFERIASLKKSHPNLKILLSIGGWNAHSEPFNNILHSHEKTKQFAAQAASYIRSKDMDGLDVDWEYPQNKNEYNFFIKTLKDAFVVEARENGQERLLLTSAVPAGKRNIDKGFDVPYVANVMDFITVMTYDLHGSWEDITGHHSAMYAGNWETGSQRHLNVDWIMKYWQKLGVPKSKLNLGLPTYGRCFTLKTSSQHGINAPSKGESYAGKYSRQGGFLSYYEICEMLQEGGIKKFLPDQKVPYMVKGDQWCGYDDIASLKMKVRYAKSENFGGIAIWSMDLDDFNGICGQKYPLMTAIFDEMTSKSRGPTVASPEKESTSVDYKYTKLLTSDVWKNWITTSTMKPMKTTRPTTTDSAGPCDGNKSGMYPDDFSCKYFWICIPGYGGRKYTCPSNTLYDDSIKACNHKTMVTCRHFTDPCNNIISGYIADTKDCRKFWMCFSGKGYSKTCPLNTLWNQKTNVCDWEGNVICSPSSQI